MANWINLYPTSSDYTADQSAREALGGPTVSMIAIDGQLHYDEGAPVDPYNPMGLPPFTIRVKYAAGKTPSMGDSQTLVDSTGNIWDITKNSTNWNELFQTKYGNELLQVLGANTSDVTNMSGLFSLQSNLTTVAVFDTRNVTDMASMFYECPALTAVPLLPTDSCGSMGLIFMNCYNVESGALAFYQQASTQASVPLHPLAFSGCGSNTTTGAAELAQIPSDWK